MGEPEENKSCGCTIKMARFWMILFNTIFVVFGLAIAVAGGILRFGQELVSPYLEDLLKQVDAQDSSLSISELINTVGIVMILIGVIICGLGVAGWLGACCLVRMCLTIYSLVMVKLLVSKLVLIIVWFVMNNTIESRVKTSLQEAIDPFYAGDAGTDPVSVGFNFIFVKLDCCGIDNYTDLHSATNWNRAFNYSGVTYTLQTPLVCCQLGGSYPGVLSNLPSDPSCATSPNSTSSNYGTGCYGAFFDYIDPYIIYVIVTLSCVLFCELLSAVSAFILNRHARMQATQVNNAPPEPVKNSKPDKKALRDKNMEF